MASSVKKGGKINFYKVVGIEKPQGEQAQIIRAVNFSTQATNNLGKTVNSIAQVMMSTKDLQVEAFQKMTEGAKIDFKPVYNTGAVGPADTDDGGEEEQEETRTKGWLEKLLGAFKQLITFAIAVPVMKWLSDPKNVKTIKMVIEGIVKFFGFVSRFISQRVIKGLEGIKKMIEGNIWEKFVGLFQTLTNFAGLFIAIRWLKNPMKIVKDLKNLLKLFTKGLKGSRKKMIRQLGGIGLIVGAGMMIKDAIKGGPNDTGDKEPKPDPKKQEANRLTGAKGLFADATPPPNKEGDVSGAKVEGSKEETISDETPQAMFGGLIPSLAKGGWISGPMSGYPVSMDGGKNVSFIGHGTEYVAQKAAGGFVVPFDTPATRKSPGLTGSRIKEAKSRGYSVPGFDVGGPIINTPKIVPEYDMGGIIQPNYIQQFQPNVTAPIARPVNKYAIGGPIVMPRPAPVTSVTKLMQHGGEFNPVINMPQQLFVGGMIKKVAGGVKGAASAVKGGITGVIDKISSAASKVLPQSQKNQASKGGDKQAAIEAVMAVKSQADKASQEVALMSAASAKEVAAATGMAKKIKPTVVGSNNKKEGLVDKLNSYHNIWT